MVKHFNCAVKHYCIVGYCCEAQIFAKFACITLVCKNLDHYLDHLRSYTEIQNLRKYINSKYFFLDRFSQHRIYLDLAAITCNINKINRSKLKNALKYSEHIVLPPSLPTFFFPLPLIWPQFVHCNSFHTCN